MDQKQQFAQQMKLQQIAQKKKELALPIIEKKMTETLFSGSPSDSWLSAARCAMWCSQPLSHKANLDDFSSALRAISADTPVLTLSQFAVVANSIESVAPNIITMDANHYESIVHESLQHVAKWNAEIKAINEQAYMEVEAEYKAAHPDPSADDGTAPMKPVIGEA